MQTCWSLNSLFLGSILMLDCHHQICAGLIRIRKTPFKSSCSDPIFDVTEGFINTSIKFKPKRGILITSGIETFKFYLSSSLFLGHPCGKRKEKKRKQFSQTLLYEFWIGGMCCSVFIDRYITYWTNSLQISSSITHHEFPVSKSVVLVRVLAAQMV